LKIASEPQRGLAGDVANPLVLSDERAETRRGVLGRVYDSLFRQDDWNIGLVESPITDFLDPSAKPKIVWLPRTEFSKCLADPFAVTRDHKTYVFCEEFDYRTFKGRIVYTEIDGIRTAAPKAAIELSTHMSYPYLLEYESETYCIPETAEAGEAALYKAEEFPSRWVKVGSLLRNFPAVDSTVFRYQGRWWLTCTKRDDARNSKLFVWHSAELLGPWKPHAANPVKVDIHSSRPAGTPFVHGGHLYRPAQDCSRTYGGRIVLNRIDTLTPSQFVEEDVAVIGPYLNGPYAEGVHTLSAVGNRTLTDGKRFIFNRNAFEHEFMRNAAKLRSAATHIVPRRETNLISCGKKPEASTDPGGNEG